VLRINNTGSYLSLTRYLFIAICGPSPKLARGILEAQFPKWAQAQRIKCWAKKSPRMLLS
jgi:hypothetical protein